MMRAVREPFTLFHRRLPSLSGPATGTLCGIAAASCWAASFVAARHGVKIGFQPADLVLYRFVPPGLLLLPFVMRTGLADLGGIGWRRGIVLAIFGGPVQALAAYTGFMLVPLGHGVVIQPACAALGALVLARLFLREHVSLQRLVGAAVMICGLFAFAAESSTTIGATGIAGDLLFVAAGTLWALFGITLKFWSVGGPRAAIAVTMVALVLYTPLHALIWGYERIVSLPLSENLLQIVVQGALAAALPIYLFARAVTLLGAGRAGTFTALVPCFAIVFGALTIGEWPTLLQLTGLVIVLVGFRFALKS
jgi:drug/metabolite transporter (DMT)-like permease